MSTESSRAALVLFDVAGRNFALRLHAVERVIPIVDITPLPKAPRAALGIVNLHGEILPVLDVRRRLRLKARAPRLSDHLIIANTSRRRVALPVDQVLGVEAFDEALVMPAASILPGADRIEGAVATPEGTILIQDIDQFMSLNEERQLNRAIEVLDDADNE